MHLAPKAGVTTIDWIGAPLTGGITAGASVIGAQVLGAWGLLPSLAADVVDSAAFAVATGVVASLPVVLGFWLKFRRQTADFIESEDAQLSRERQTVLTELRSDLDERRKEIVKQRALIDALNLSVHERDTAIAARDATIAGLNQQITLLTGLGAGKGSAGAGGVP